MQLSASLHRVILFLRIGILEAMQHPKGFLWSILNRVILLIEFNSYVPKNVIIICFLFKYLLVLQDKH